MSVLHIESAGEASVHVVVFLDDVGIHWGIVAGRQLFASSVAGRQYAANCRGDKLWDAAAAPSARGIVRERRAWVASVALLHGTTTATATASSPTSTRRASVVEGLESRLAITRVTG